MFISATKSSLGVTYYLSKSFKVEETGKYSSKTVERIGTEAELQEKLGPDVDIQKWLKNYAKQRTEEEKNNIIKMQIHLQPNKKIKKNKQLLKNGGYLFLQKIMYELKVNEICEEIAKKENLNYDLFQVFECLVFDKIYSSEQTTRAYDFAQNMLEDARFESQDVYKSIKILAKYSDQIQLKIHENERKLKGKKNNKIYYDCSNYFFENSMNEDSTLIKALLNDDEAITELRMYFNEDSAPLAYATNINGDNLNKIDEFVASKYKEKDIYICPFSASSNNTTKIINKFKDNKQITLFPATSLNSTLQNWVKNPEGWKVYGSNKTYNIHTIDKILHYGKVSRSIQNKIINEIFYKVRKVRNECPKTGKLIEENVYVFFNFELQEYMKSSRKNTIERINREIDAKNSNLDISDAKSVIKKLQGIQEQIKSSIVSDKTETRGDTYNLLDESGLQNNAQLDGYYAMFEKPEEKDIAGIINTVCVKAQIEYVFKNIKNELEARQDITSKESVSTHCLTSFTALLIFRILEARLKYEFWNAEILYKLGNMNFVKIANDGWVPIYSPSELSDKLHEVFGFETDFEFLTEKTMQNIIVASKTQD